MLVFDGSCRVLVELFGRPAAPQGRKGFVAGNRQEPGGNAGSSWNLPACRQTSRNTSLTMSSAADLSPTKRRTNRKTRTLCRAYKIFMAWASPAAIDWISASLDVSEAALVVA